MALPSSTLFCCPRQKNGMPTKPRSSLRAPPKGRRQPPSSFEDEGASSASHTTTQAASNYMVVLPAATCHYC
jgi:hypothetical protein